MPMYIYNQDTLRRDVIDAATKTIFPPIPRTFRVFRVKTPRLFNISTPHTPKPLGHFNHFNPNPKNSRPFQLFAD